MLAKERIYPSALSVPAEQFSTSVLAEQLSAIEVGVKKLHVVYAANDNFYGGAAPGAPVVPTPLCYSIDWSVIRSQASTADNYPLKVRAIPFRSCAEFFNICIHVQGKCAL